MKFLMKIVVSGFAVVISSYLLPGVTIDSFLTALVVAFLIALLNVFLKPVLILLTIPITVFTLGLFLLVINAIIILIVSNLTNGFYVDGLWWALLFSIILSIVMSILESFNKPFEKNNYE